jgi:hypothetical protein
MRWPVAKEKSSAGHALGIVVNHPNVGKRGNPGEVACSHRREDSNMTNIEFTPDESYEHHRRKVVWFSAIDDEKVINCAISIEALADHFGAYADDPLPAFRSHREQIHECAAKLMLRVRQPQLRYIERAARAAPLADAAFPLRDNSDPSPWPTQKRRRFLSHR